MCIRDSLCHAVVDELPQHGHFVPTKGGLYVGVLVDIVVVIVHLGVIYAIVYRNTSLKLGAAGALAAFGMAIIDVVHVVALQIAAVGLA